MSLSAPSAPVRPKRVLPGFGLSIGVTMIYLTVIVLVPVAALVLKGADIGFARYWQIVTGPRTLAAFKLTLTAAAMAPPQLATGCALLAARLVPGSKTACRLVTQHTRALEPAVAALVQARRYAEAQALLKAAGEFAREP